jgi:CheY-like chemotaxis protein
MRGVSPPLDIFHVLLVEDDPGDELITREAFEDNKVHNTLHVVRDGSEALDFLYRRGIHAQAPRPGLILLDLNLPIIDGREVLSVIRSDPYLRAIPVVILSASQVEEDIARSYRLNASAYLTKPVDFTGFMEVVRQIDGFYVGVVRVSA